MKDTWADLPKSSTEEHAKLSALISPLDNYRIYRTKLAQVKGPCLPYFGLIVRDLVYIDEGNPDTLQGLINFSKWEMNAKQFSQITEYQVHVAFTQHAE